MMPNADALPVEPTPNAAQLLVAATALGIDRLDAQLLLLHALKRPSTDRAWLLAHDTDPLPSAIGPVFLDLCSRRAEAVPVAYLLGEKEFHGIRLHVDARVLVPRPDTETLVDWALQALKGTVAPTVLDLGTGSGAIALAIQRARPDADVTAVDASAEALEVASANARALALQVRFIEADWLNNVEGDFTLIVSNPPYVAEGDPHLHALRHEPLRALVAGHDGLDDLRHIIRTAPEHLRNGGWLLLEHGHDQHEAIQGLLVERGFEDVQSRHDLAGIARCSGGIWRTVK